MAADSRGGPRRPPPLEPCWWTRGPMTTTAGPSPPSASAEEFLSAPKHESCHGRYPAGDDRPAPSRQCLLRQGNSREPRLRYGNRRCARARRIPPKASETGATGLRPQTWDMLAQLCRSRNILLGEKRDGIQHADRPRLPPAMSRNGQRLASRLPDLAVGRLPPSLPVAACRSVEP